jgi:hypothetical protein
MGHELGVHFNLEENLLTFQAILPPDGQLTIGYASDNMYSAEDFCLWHNDDEEEEDDQITQFDLSPVWKKGGGPTAYGGETNDYWTTVEKLESGSTKFTSTRKLDTEDPYDYVVETDKLTKMAFSIIYEGKERLGSFEIQLEG